jgi:hypothetical protein
MLREKLTYEAYQLVPNKPFAAMNLARKSPDVKPLDHLLGLQINRRTVKTSSLLLD